MQNKNKTHPRFYSKECFKVFVEGHDGVVSYPLQEFVKCFLPRFQEVLIEPICHVFTECEFLWERLKGNIQNR